MAKKKFAIFMGNTEFPETNGALPPLPSSRKDVIALQNVLTGPQQGWFTDPLSLIDLPHHKLMLSINQVFRKATRDDEILLYYSGHGQLDSRGYLHFATIDTDLNLLHATSLPAVALGAMLRETRCRRIAMVLDCCYYGTIGDSQAFEKPFNRSVKKLTSGITDGYAISIIAASIIIDQDSDCDEKALGQLTNSIIEGITSGEADSNDDGLISIDELFGYVEGKMPGAQKPAWYSSGPVDSLIVSRSKTGQITANLIESLKAKLDNAVENNDIGRFIYDSVYAILDQSPDEIAACHESNIRLLTAWSKDKVSHHEFMEQWYEFNDTGLPEAKTSDHCTDIKDRWEVVRICRKPAIDLTSPTYILDRNFQFLDWNPMFDELVAKPLALMRGRHVEEFILKLDNKSDVIRRGRAVFELDQYPIVDTEILKLKTQYGLVKFRKIASQIADEDGGTLAWAVNLNILEAEDDERMWNDLAERLEQEVNWSLYAKSYDRMLLNFDSYHALVEKIVSLLGGEPLTVLDLASGTGNVTMEMLRRSADRTVWALEANEDMLEYMRQKISQLDSKKNEKVQILKGDLLLSLRESDDESFDGAVMMNALYAMPDRARCLREIFRVLKPGGVLVYSSSTTETDVERLFAAVRTNLSQKGCLDSMRSIVDSAYERNIQMMDNIVKDTHNEVVNYAIHAGFSVDDADVERGAYEGAVTIVKAVKKAIKIGKMEKIVPPDQKVRVFVSYAHEDLEWCERIKNYLNPLTQNNEIEVWTDQALEYGDHWRSTISEKLEQSTVAILLVSTAFLNSNFITNNELPALLHSAKSKGLLIVPVILEQCLFKYVTYKFPHPMEGPEEFNLAELQVAGSPTESMAMLDKPQQNLVLYEIAKRILSLKQKTD